MSATVPSGFDAMGHQVSDERRELAYRTARGFGLSQEDAWSVVGEMAGHLADDEPNCAMKTARQYVDLTGTYRLMACLLAGGEES